MSAPDITLTTALASRAALDTIERLQTLIVGLRQIDPALRALIDARLACEVCMNPKHEWNGEAHGDACQTFPLVSDERFANAAEALEAANRAADDDHALLSTLAGAATAFWERHGPALPDDVAAEFEDVLLAPLMAATAEDAGPE